MNVFPLVQPFEIPKLCFSNTLSLTIDPIEYYEGIKPFFDEERDLEEGY